MSDHLCKCSTPHPIHNFPEGVQSPEERIKSLLDENKRLAKETEGKDEQIREQKKFLKDEEWARGEITQQAKKANDEIQRLKDLLDEAKEALTPFVVMMDREIYCRPKDYPKGLPTSPFEQYATVAKQLLTKLGGA